MRGKFRLVAIVWGLLAAIAAYAQPPGGEWAARPTESEISAAAPETARSSQGGRAAARCHVEDDGSLSRCVVVRETPGRQGYGPALLTLAPKYRRTPPRTDDLRDVVIVADWFNVDAPTDWQKRPSAQELMAVYPAKGKGDGRAVVNCLVTTQGALTECEVLAERPVGLGFGMAGVALTPQFLMKPATWKGQPAQTTVTIPINWSGFDQSYRQTSTKRVVPANLPWTEAPSFADVAMAYPQKARTERRAGHVAMSCQLSEEGRLVRCDMGNTDPAGMGFDNAARGLAKKFRFSVANDADRKATRSIVIHVTFTFDPAALDQAVIGKPNWAVLPNDAQVAAAFSGLNLEETARAVLNCAVQPGGVLDQCSIASEQPADKGVGPAAMTLSTAFRVTTWTAEGLPVVGGRLNIPIRYEPETAPPPAPK